MKRNLVPHHLLAPYVNELWREAPSPLVRSDPSTWMDVGERWANTTPPTAGVDTTLTAAPSSYRHLSHTTENSEWRFHGLGFRTDFVAATSAHPNVLYMVEALLGGTVRKPNANRGVYSIFPRHHKGHHKGQGGGGDPDEPLDRLVPHIDSHPFQVRVRLIPTDSVLVVIKIVSAFLCVQSSVECCT